MEKESGQAIVELTAVLLALCFVVIGILFVGGAGITATKTLLSARYDAERNAAGATSGNGPASDIGSWQYTSVTYQKNRMDGKITIPFLSGDTPEPVSNRVNSSYLFEDQAPSQAELNLEPDEHGRVRNYIFLPRSNLVELTTPHNMLFSSSAELANLHFSSGTTPSSEEIYTLRKLENTSDFRERIYRAGWFDLRNMKVSNWRSNQVAMPAFGPITPGVDE